MEKWHASNRFSKVIKLKAFLPFKSAEEALEAINDISEGKISAGTPARMCFHRFLSLSIGKSHTQSQPR
jgi:hypothetical protein